MANKKITWKKLVPKLPAASTSVIKLDENAFGVPELSVKRFLDMASMASFVNDVVSMCVDNDSVEYTPEVYDFAMRLSVMNHYAGVSLPSGADDNAAQKQMAMAYCVLYETDIIDQIMNCINMDQYTIMAEAIEQRIQYARDLFVSAAAQKTMDLVSKMDEVMSESKAVLDQVDSENFGKALENMANAGMFGAMPVRDALNDSVTESIIPTASAVSSEDNVVLMRPKKTQAKR